MSEFAATGDESRIRRYLTTVAQSKLSELQDARESCIALRQMIDLSGRDFDFLEQYCEEMFYVKLRNRLN